MSTQNETNSTVPPQDLDYTYNCVASNAVNETVCANTCVGLDACNDCQCAILPTTGEGAWGPVMDVIFCLLPILFLIIVTVKPRNPWPTTKSLPTAAIMLYFIRLMYLASDPLQSTAAIILGLHEALTPLSIMAGAITLFETMEVTYCMPYMMREIKALTQGHPVAECMLIFNFAYMVEGASGFGTPVALGAPMLVSQGHKPLESIVTLLIFNTFATVWGAVGTPIWFGLGTIGLTDAEFLEISFKAAIALGFGSLIVIPWVLLLLVPKQIVKSNLLFIYLSIICCCVGPSLAISFVSYEFPSLIGGLVGCVLTSIVIKCNIGLRPLPDDYEETLGRHRSDITSVSQQHGLVREYHKSASNVSEVTTTIPENTLNQTEVGRDCDHTENGEVERCQKDIEQQSEPQETENIESDEKKSNENGPVGVRTTVLMVSSANDVADSTENSDTPAASSDRSTSNPNAGPIVSFTSDQSATVSMRTDLIDDHLGPRKGWNEGYIRESLLRTFPIWASILLLILTRVDQIGIKPYLNLRQPYFEIWLGTYGTFRLSVSVVFQLLNILTYPNMNWKYEFFYIPFIMPFLLVSAVTLFIYRKDLKATPWQIVKVVGGRLRNPAIALMGALVLVQLMIKQGASAPATILGTTLASWFQEGFIVISPLLGALGSFFSGSTTVSNLTFGDIQEIAASAIGTSVTSMLALQSVGASAGNGICLNNIISACAVVGLNVGEGKILGQTYKYVLTLTTIATVVMLIFFFRFS